VMYDWSPADLTWSGTGWPGCTTAPYVFGFAMAPTSAALTAGAACTVKTAQPAASATTDKEVLIGTDFYTAFKVSSDCQCAGARADKGTTVPSDTTVWPANTPVTGVLLFSAGTTVESGHQSFSPTEAGPLTNTVAGPM